MQQLMLGVPVTELFSIKVNVLFCFAKKKKQKQKNKQKKETEPLISVSKTSNWWLSLFFSVSGTSSEES